jgi:hypothetical protein
MRAEDGDGERDDRLTDPQAIRALADRVDAHQGTPAEIALRGHILTFYVDKAPRLLTTASGFAPTPNQVYPTRSGIGFNLLADDDDPLDPGNRPPTPGGPSSTKVLRWQVSVRGRDSANRVIDYQVTSTPDFQPQFTVDLPSTMVSTSDTVLVQLCDCPACEETAGSGRCADYAIPIIVPPPVPAGAGQTAPPAAQPRPGPSKEVRRRAP